MSETMNKPPMTNEQIAFLVKLYRADDGLGWSQETLAELSGLTVRTIQRVEAGEPSSVDTRRAIARAMQIEDIEVFSKPWPFTSPEIEAEAERQRVEFERKHVLLDAEAVDGRGLVLMLLDEPGFRAMCPAPMDELPPPVQDQYALIIDFYRDCMDLADEVPRADMLSFGDQLTSFILALGELGFTLLAARRNVATERGRVPPKTIQPDSIIYLHVVKKEVRLKKIAVPRDLGRMVV